MPSLQPKTNEMARLYAMTSANVDPKSDKGTVLFIDPSDTKILYETEDDDVLSDNFDAFYLDHTLEEIRNGKNQEEGR